MKKDFLKELEYLGVTARLKRLNDNVSASIKELYKAENIDIEPSWHLLLIFLKKRKLSTMSEIAEEFNYSQAAATKMITRMVNKGYIETAVDGNDSRKKNLRLSKKAKKELPKFERVWNAGQNSIKEILKTNKDFLAGLEDFENKLNSKSFSDRALEKLKG